MAPLAPSFQVPFSLPPPVGGGPPSETQTQASPPQGLCTPTVGPAPSRSQSLESFRPGSKGDRGGQGLRRGPSAAPQAARAGREGSQSSGPHPRVGAAPLIWCLPPRQEGGARRHSSGRDPPPGRTPALSGPLTALQPAAIVYGGAPKPTSDPPGASRSGRHLERLFTGSAGPPYEGEPPAFHQIAPADFSTGPRDTGEPCTAFCFAPLDRDS
ncbi:hypothetical protein NDU88_005580 [Pleurodeles waltl]|uniref:Uncharacterized protein n=1 Tax=Pleurodeles waltl TaxID=8319 RepID=A0AAV7VNY3_PLEWA|nr:hypothetical protein NDU88_005580 [Pleurodeles waltl]